jgi:hypothetical protein
MLLQAENAQQGRQELLPHNVMMCVCVGGGLRAHSVMCDLSQLQLLVCMHYGDQPNLPSRWPLHFQIPA